MRRPVWFVLTFVLLGACAFLGSLYHKTHTLLDRARTECTATNRRLEGLLAREQGDTYNIGKFTRPEDRPGELMPPMPDDLQKQLREYRTRQLFVPDLVPVPTPYAISQGFKPGHPALDFAAPQDSKVMAAATGLVASVYVDPVFGNVMTIDHLNGITTFYAHLDDVFFRVGDLVKKGEPIALVGNTGRSSGAHLHFEIREGKVSVDPQKYLSVETDQP